MAEKWQYVNFIDDVRDIKERLNDLVDQVQRMERIAIAEMQIRPKHISELNDYLESTIKEADKVLDYFEGLHRGYNGVF